MKALLAATAAIGLMAATGAWAQDQSETRPPVTQDQSTSDTNGVLGAGKNAAPGVTGSVHGSSTDATATTGGTGQPGSGQRTIDPGMSNASPSGANSGAPAAGSMGAPAGGPSTGAP